MKLILAGTPAFASAIFAPLIENKTFEILALICQPDKPFGRKGELKSPHTKETFLSQDIQILQPDKITESVIATLQALKPDAILVVAYGKILPKAFLDIAPCISIQVSLYSPFHLATMAWCKPFTANDSLPKCIFWYNRYENE